MMTHDERSAKRAIAETMAGLDPATQERVLTAVQAKLSGPEVFDAGIRELNAMVAEREGEHQFTQAQYASLRELLPWLSVENPKLERNDCSRIHKLQEAINERRVVLLDKKTVIKPSEGAGLLASGAQPFVVQHDWAAAFKNATDYGDGEFNLPFEHCAFEFRISGITVIVIAMQPSPETRSRLEPRLASEPFIAIPFVEKSGFWWCREEAGRNDPALRFAWEQIRAICIALDAEVAERDIVRAPVALNEKRAKRGQPPLQDYHVVSLHGRHSRVKAPTGGTHRSPRMHFRRGHWRHYETHRTWIKWMLVGDPDLGFIDKSYRL